MSMAVPVAAPQLAPPALSLVRAASLPNDPDNRWALDGVTYSQVFTSQPPPWRGCDRPSPG